MTEYKGKSYNVTGASAEFASIEVNGRKKRLYGSPRFQPERASTCAPGFVRFESQNASAQIITYLRRWHENGSFDFPAMVKAGIVSSTGEYQCTVSANESHPDCFLAVIFFCLGDDGNPDMASSAVAFREIGTLEAGKKTAVSINGGYVPRKNARYYCCPMIFSRGVEIRTDQSPAADKFFRQQEMVAHQHILESYRQKFPATDHPAVLYLRVPPELPGGIDRKGLPPEIKARFAVTESGEVDAVYLGEGLDPKAEQAISRALQGWLFLPRLRQGDPVRIQVEMPVAFE